MTDDDDTPLPYTVVNVGQAHAPEPPQKTADKKINEMTLLDYQKACAAFYAPKKERAP